jgi:hypothetical protein
MINSFPADEYLRAFRRVFQDANGEQLDYKIINDLLVVEYQDNSFVIAHYNDFNEVIKSYFDGRRFDKILLLPVQLWDELIKNELEGVSISDWLTRLYGEWKIYWERKKSEKADLTFLNQEREDSWKELQVLFSVLSVEGSEALVKAACGINDRELIPIVAFAIKAHYTYDFYDEFLSDCILTLTEKCQVYLSNGGRFDCVVLGDLDKKPFFIYNSDHKKTNNYDLN